MKYNLLLILSFLGFSNLVHAQTHDGIYFQGAARNANGNVLINTPINLRYSIHDSVANGAVVYQETISTTTTAQGMFTVTIGKGTPVIGNYNTINWGKNDKFVQTEIATNGNNYVDMGTTQMMSVPYALYAKSAGNLNDNPDFIFNNHGYLNLVNDTFFVIKKTVNLEITLSSGNGGKAGNGQCWVNLGGPQGGIGAGLRFTINAKIGDTVYFKVGKNGNDGCNFCVSSCQYMLGSNGQSGTNSIISINDMTFSNFIFKCIGGTGGFSGFLNSCTQANPGYTGSNGSITYGNQYMNSSAVVIDSNIGGGQGILIRW